jgi:hypothetical protein
LGGIPVAATRAARRSMGQTRSRPMVRVSMK